ncbi:HXXEE domain-containing protein [Lactobacillus paragasseri]|uniref:HXXEE domain-containing protein n=1 Tax=Lactobacillus paragasseri TaxID=2107999 RepID=UPI003B9BFEAB
MDKMNLILLFPTLFMLHEMEEIVFMPKFLKALKSKENFPTSQFRHFVKVISPFQFNLIIFQQLILLFISSIFAYYFHLYIFYMSIMLAFSYHILGHVIQMVLLKKYVPGVLTGLFSSFLVIYFGGSWSVNWGVTVLLSMVMLVIIIGNLGLMYRLTGMLNKTN